MSEFVPRSKEQVASSLKFMDKLLAKDVSKGKIQDIEAKEARDRITVLDYDTQGIKGFRDADMVIEVIASVLVRACPLRTFVGCLRELTTQAITIQISFRDGESGLHHGVEHFVNQYHKDRRRNHPRGCFRELREGYEVR